MSRIREVIDVALPVSAAFRRWRQFEETPPFRERTGVLVSVDDPALESAVTLAGVVTFAPLGPSRTRIGLELDLKTEAGFGAGTDPGAAPAGGDATPALEIISHGLRQDLDRFRQSIESLELIDAGLWTGLE